MEEIQKLQHLEWLLDEVDSSFREATGALEQFMVDPTDTEQLVVCMRAINQVQGALRVINVPGPQLFIDEIEQVADALMSGDLDDDLRHATEMLTQSLLRLPIYLRQLISTRVDNPASLLVFLNDLRVIRHQSTLSSLQFFTLDMKQALTPKGKQKPLRSDAFDALAKKIGQIYQVALAKLLVRDNFIDNLEFLKKTCAKLTEVSQGAASEILWRSASAVLEGIGDRSISLGPAVISILQNLSKEITRLANQGVAALQLPPDEELVKDMLFYVAQGRCELPVSAALRDELSLDESLPAEALYDNDKQFLALGDGDVSRALAVSFAAEIGHIKDSLERFSTEDDLSVLAQAESGMGRLADSLLLIGAHELSARARDIVIQLGALGQADMASRADLAADTAHEIEEIEAGTYKWLAKHRGVESLDNSDGRTVLGSASISLMNEARSSLETIKEAIVEYISSQWQAEKLDGIPELISNTSGAFKMLELEKVSRLLDGCNSFITEQLLAPENNEHPDWSQLDALAETIVCIEYYLDSLDKNEREGVSQILLRAEEKIAALGSYFVSEQPEPVENLAESVDITIPEPVALPETAEESEIDDDFIDTEILAIFAEEAREVVEELQQQYPRWVAAPTDTGILGDIRRGFHTLKGSGRMVGAELVGNLAWSVENLLNRLIDKRVENSPTVMALVDLVIEQLPGLTKAFEKRTPVENRVYIDELISTAEQLAKNVAAELPSSDLAATEAVVPVMAETTDDVDLQQEQVRLVEDSGSVESEISGIDGFDDTYVDENQELYAIFASEAELHLQTVEEFVLLQQREAPVFTFPPGAVQRALHTLKGSAKMAELSAIDAIVEPLEHFVKELFNRQLDVDRDILTLMEDAISYIRTAISQLQSGDLTEIPQTNQFRARVRELHERALLGAYGDNSALESTAAAPAADPELLNALMTEGMQQVLAADELLDQWQENAAAGFIPEMAEELGSLETAAEKAGISPLQELAGLMKDAYRQVNDQSLPAAPELVDSLQRAHNCLLDMADTVAASLDVPTLDDAVAAELRGIASRQYPVEQVVDAPASSVSSFEQRPIEPIIPIASSEIDLSILEIFLQEADELCHELDQALSSWRDNRQDTSGIEAAKRLLHTLKGGARMTGLVQLGDLVHDLESDIITLSGRKAELNDGLFEYLFGHYENINRSIDAARTLYEQGVTEVPEVPLEPPVSVEPSPVSVEPPPVSVEPPPVSVEPPEQERAVVNEPEAPAPEQAPHVPDDEEIPVADTGNPVVDTGFAAQEEMPHSPVEPPPVAALSVQKELEKSVLPDLSRKQVAQEMVRVASDVIENLVNLAGESSISRGRIEQQVSQFHSSLDEMEATILRLQGQVRLLGIETEAQIMFRREQIEASSSVEGFDPLEMDRYSQLQHLAKGLMESSSDLLDLRSTLVNSTRDAETQLLAQSRIQSELQESLMRAQMVPFSHIVPRLKRIVRQVSDELGRKVNLSFSNQEGEMDRSVLEKMIAPLEHMIRNAIDHGLEEPELRRQLGKPEAGSITIGLQRRGGEVLLNIADDGKGLDINRIRTKAIEQGLMVEHSRLTDHEVSQFIFHAGFSTSETLTQLSGRGVGMDVVYSQVRQLGGSVDLQSTPGQGTEFKVRLPFTVSVNRALMVGIRDDLYALPLNSINGVVNISPAELENYYQNPETKLNYGGAEYDIYYLGTLLSDDLAPKIDLSKTYHSLVLVQSEAGYYAVHVDRLLASQEVVVKSLGAQFSTVSGLSGATILGDGRVVVILDLIELLRSQAAFVSSHRALPKEETVTAKPGMVPTVLVVDDSVTVRKVTGRFLQREGFEVLTAKDGVEAIQVLQDQLPDLILLDIEMPRMDGFEVARRVKNARHWQQIPIIMITSRTGEKHRERAAALGVEGYVGKPYQEDMLLENIQELLGVRV